MTPKENKLIQLFYPNVQWKLGQEDCLDRAERCVLIAEDFAIGFGEYLDSLTAQDMGILSIKELLEIYKETL